MTHDDFSKLRLSVGFSVWVWDVLWEMFITDSKFTKIALCEFREVFMCIVFVFTRVESSCVATLFS